MNTDATFEKVEPNIKGRGGRRNGAGRKSGTPNRATRDVRQLAREYGPTAMLRIAELAGVVMGADGKPQGMALSDKVQVAALALLLDRAYGRAAQPLIGEDDNPLIMVTHIELIGPDGDDPHCRTDAGVH